MLREAVRVPVAEGLKMTEMEQLEPAATLDPQVLVWVKSLALEPETATLVTLNDALPVLVTFTDWAELAAPTGWLANARELVERLTAQAAAVPVPEKFTFWVLILALSVIVKV